MKKLISILLAVAMLATCGISAFATDITKDSVPQNATADVVTKTTDSDGNAAYTYSVTIPASIEVAWGDTTAQDASYTVTSQLLLGASLQVAVTTVNNGAMTNASATGYSLTYALANGEAATFNEVNTDAAPTTAPTVTIADFSGVPVAAYTGTLTYSVTYVAP